MTKSLCLEIVLFTASVALGLLVAEMYIEAGHSHTKDTAWISPVVERIETNQERHGLKQVVYYQTCDENGIPCLRKLSADCLVSTTGVAVFWLPLEVEK